MNCVEGENPRIKIPQGILEGFVLRSRKKRMYYGFYGIPYGRAERFELPKKWESWNGVLNATKAKERCIQINKATKRFIGSESGAHFLNVFTPAFQIQDPNDLKGLPPAVPPEKYPVIVFIHGGGYAAGGGDLFGNRFLVDENVILVTVNYRLGALGFINIDGIANLGLHDQCMAMKWVQQNIKYFAGDNENVTLMGESAGAGCVHLHQLSPLSSGLFHKAIMQSGTAICPWAFNHLPAEKLKKLLKQLEINGFSNNHKTEIMTKLRKLDACAIVAQRTNYEQALNEDGPSIHFAPSIESGPANDKKFLTDSPMQLLQSGKIVNEVPLLMGINSEEALYRSLPILRDPTKLKALNDHWSHELPRHLMYKKDCVSQHEDFAKSLRRFYFDSKPIVLADSQDARERLTNMISDRLFIYPFRRTALIHRAVCKDPANKIYLYNFKYTGDYSFCNGFEVQETYGACHADELQYLMNQRIFYSKISPGSQADEIIEKMIGLWGSFAWRGVPEYRRQTRPWVPLPSKHEVLNGKLKYFCIDVEDGMMEEPFTDRMDFWDHVPNLSLTF